MITKTHSFRAEPEAFKKMMHASFPEFTRSLDESNWNDFHNFNAVIEDINMTAPDEPFEDVSVYFDMTPIFDEPMGGIRFMLLYAINAYVVAIEGERMVSIDWTWPREEKTMISVNDWVTNQEPAAYRRIQEVMDRNS